MKTSKVPLVSAGGTGLDVDTGLVHSSLRPPGSTKQSETVPLTSYEMSNSAPIAMQVDH